jgi:hypothetical protein
MINPMRATVEAIAEEDNDIGGTLFTRTRQSFTPGRNDGSTDAGAPTTLTSPVDVFSSANVGMGIDILRKATPTGNEGAYVVASYVDAKNVTLNKIDGTAAVLVTEADVQWRFTTLKVETTYQFPDRDRNLKLYVGVEESAIGYAQLVQTPGAQEFRGLGAYLFYDEAIISAAAPLIIQTLAPIFTADMAGVGLWVLPADPSVGNEGPRRIASVDSSRQVTLTGTALSADESKARIMIQLLDPDGYLTLDHRENTEIVCASGGYSALERLRRSFWVNYAEGEELDRIGRNHATDRPKILNDYIYRRYLRVRPYLATQTIYAFELVLEALFPQGGWEIYEDLKSHPNEIFITLPMQDLSSDTEGKAFMNMIDEIDSDTAQQVTLTEDPLTVESIRCQTVSQDLEMDVLPTADSPAWTYGNEGAAEGAVFSVASSLLTHAQTAGTANGGRYYRTVAQIDPQRATISAWWLGLDNTLVGGYPWHLLIEDGEREYCYCWDDAGAHVLTKTDGTVIAGPVSGFATFDSNWHRVRLERNGDLVQAYFDDLLILEADESLFDASANTRLGFGYLNLSANQNFQAQWDRVAIQCPGVRNFWNLTRWDGSLAAAAITSASALFIAGHTGKHIRTYSDLGENDGVWLATYNAPTVLDLDGIERVGAQVSGKNADPSGALVTLDEPWFGLKDASKSIVISGSALGNDGTYSILEFISPHQLRVDNAGGFAAEVVLTWKFLASFTVEASVKWELVEAGSIAGAVLTLQDTLPLAVCPVEVNFTIFESAQILLNEFIQNLGTYYPFYLWDADRFIQAILDDISAAGVIPRYEIDY